MEDVRLETFLAGNPSLEAIKASGMGGLIDVSAKVGTRLDKWLSGTPEALKTAIPAVKQAVGMPAVEKLTDYSTKPEVAGIMDKAAGITGFQPSKMMEGFETIKRINDIPFNRSADYLEAQRALHRPQPMQEPILRARTPQDEGTIRAQSTTENLMENPPMFFGVIGKPIPKFDSAGGRSGTEKAYDFGLSIKDNPTKIAELEKALNAEKDVFQKQFKREALEVAKGEINPFVDGYKQLTNEKENSLMVLHNITEDKYNQAKKIGGLANPSMAVKDINKGGFDSFGDITLVGDKSLITSPKARTFAADVYSPRFPNTQTKIKSFDVIRDRLKRYEKDADENVGGDIDTSDLRRSLENSTLTLSEFLDKKNIKLPKIGDKGIEYHSELRSVMKNTIDSKGLRGEYKNHVEDLIKSAGGEDMIFKGYTNQGNKRYSPLTAENASREMSTEAARGGENFNYGLGSTRAMVTPEFRTIAKIKENQGKIVSNSEFESLKKGYEDNYSLLLEKLEGYDKIKDSNSFIAYDRRSQALADYIGGKDRQFFRQKFPDLPENIVNEIEQFKATIKEMPTEYFETKFKRVVQPSEFRYAVVPDKTATETISKLRQDGLQVLPYKTGDNADRLAKIKTLKKITAFSFLLGAMGYENQDKGFDELPKDIIAKRKSGGTNG